MAKGYRPVDRDQQFLMPPDMREWLPAGHAVWTLIDVVGLLDTSEFHARCRTGGAGRAGYDPDMMLTLLMYAYSQGIRSSRRIERLCWQDVAYRVICAQDAPDHTTIWRFADLGPELVRRLFTEVLVLCAKAGMARLGTITLDGMKIGANASKKANQTEERIRAELAELAARAVAEHQATDAAEGTLLGETSGDELPAEFADPRSREARLRRALEELTAAREAEQAQRDTMAREYLARQRQAPVRGRVPVAAAVEAAEHRLAQAIAAQHAKIEDWERCNTQRIADTGSGMPGRPPRPVEEHAAVIRARTGLAKAQAALARWEAAQRPKVTNTTDPDSRLMPSKDGFIQGYNPQNVVTEDGVILATELTQDTGDAQQAIPMMTHAETAAGLITSIHSRLAHAAGDQCVCPQTTERTTTPTHRPTCPVHPTGIGTMVMDAGYHSEENLSAQGPDRLIATGKRRDVEKTVRETSAPQSDQPHPTDAVERNTQRLHTPEGIATYRRRGHIAETPHGHIKHNMGIRTLTRRGLPRATVEWKLICTTVNLAHLLRTLTRTQPTTT